MAQGTAANAQRPLLLTNLRLFDGSGKGVREGVHILIQDQRIADIVPAGTPVEGAEIVDCQGKLVMPGLIDVHWHSMLAAIPQLTAMTADLGYLYLVAARKHSAPCCAASPRCAMQAALPLPSSVRLMKVSLTAHASTPAGP